MLKILFFVALVVMIIKCKEEVLKKKQFSRHVDIPDLIEDVVLVVLCSITKAMAGIFIIGFLINCLCFFIGIFLIVILVRDAFVYFW